MIFRNFLYFWILLSYFDYNIYAQSHINNKLNNKANNVQKHISSDISQKSSIKQKNKSLQKAKSNTQNKKNTKNSNIAKSGTKPKKKIIKKSVAPKLKSSILVDFEREQIIDAHNPYKRIYPASLTKLMTLYILFSELQQKKLTLDTTIKISKKASQIVASKLYLKPGDKITVEEAIYALIIKSANDVAIAIAEKLSGTEERFAYKMNYFAKKLSMSHTHFVNSSGLHNSRQFSTSADIAKLAIALKKDFPSYLRLLKSHSFHFRGKKLIAKSNLPVLQYPEVQWLKSGYTSLSGRNLLVDASIKDREFIAITVGNMSHFERNMHIRQLLDRYKSFSHKYSKSDKVLIGDSFV